MTTETVKVQRALATNDDDVPWLVYDQNRERMEQIPQRLVPNHVRAAMRRETKGYFSAEWAQNGWIIGNQVKKERW